MAKFYAWDILGGKEAFDAMKADGVTDEELMKRAKEKYAQTKDILGDDFDELRSAGLAFDKIDKFAEYKRAKDELKTINAMKSVDESGNATEVKEPTEAQIDKHIRDRQEIPDKAVKDITYLNSEEKQIDDAAKELEGESAWDRFTRTLTRNGADLGLLAISAVNDANAADWDRVTGMDISGTKEALKAISEGADVVGEGYAAARRTPEEQAGYEAAAKAFEDANTTMDTVKAGAGIIKQKIMNPDEWDLAGLSAELMNPANLIGVPAGGVASKLATSMLGKVATGTAVGAGSEAAINAGYEYGLAKAKDKDDEEAKKAAIMGGSFGAAIGAPGGAVGALLHNKWSAEGSAPQGKVYERDNFKDALDTSNSQLPPDSVDIPDDIKSSTLLALEEVEDHSAKADALIKEISAQASDPTQRDMLVEKHLQPTQAEEQFTYFINDGSPVSARLAGGRLRKALEVSIAEGADDAMSLEIKLHEAGFGDDVKAAVIESYTQGDISIFDHFVADKIERKIKGGIDASRRVEEGSGRTDPAVQESGDRIESAKVGKELDSNTEQKALPGDQAGDNIDPRDTGHASGKSGTGDEVSEIPEAVDGYRTPDGDGGDVPGYRKEYVVQTEDGVRAQREITPVEKYAILKDDPDLPTEYKAKLKESADAYVTDTDVVETPGPVSRAGEAYDVDTKKLESFAVDVPSETNIPKFMSDFAEPIDTPIGKFKIETDYLLNKAMDRDSGLRSNELHLIKPTLEEPAFVVKYREGYNFIKPFKKDGKVKRYLSVISDKNGDIRFVTTHHLRNNDIRKILRDGDVIVDNVGGSLRAGAESTGSRNQRPATPSKSIAEELGYVKMLGDLKSHRYFSSLVEQIEAQKNRLQARYKSPELGKLKADLQKRGWDPSEPRYKAEIQKGFKKLPKDPLDAGFHRYSAKELKRIKSGEFRKNDQPLARKLKEDLKAFYENPIFERDREAIDMGYKEYLDEVDMLRMLDEDERVGLVESESYVKGYDDPVRIEDVSTRMDDQIKRSDEVLSVKGDEADPLDALFGEDTGIKLSKKQKKILDQIPDPLKRITQKIKFELKTLEGRLKGAKKGGDKGAITRAENALKQWKDEFMSNGKIKEIGEEC